MWGIKISPGKSTIPSISHRTPKYQKLYALCGQILQHTSEDKYLGDTLRGDLQYS